MLSEVHFCQCHNKTFEEFYAKPKKRSTFVRFHAEKRSTFEKFYTKPIKKVHFCQISR